MILLFEGFPEMYVCVTLLQEPCWSCSGFSRDNRKLDRPLSASLGIFGLVNVASVWCVWWVCISTAAAELDIKYFCPMKYFCVLSPWCSFSANLVRSISPHRMHFRFWYKKVCDCRHDQTELDKTNSQCKWLQKSNFSYIKDTWVLWSDKM